MASNTLDHTLHKMDSTRLSTLDSTGMRSNEKCEDDPGVQHHRFKTMTWFQAGLVMIAETISLGILSLPHAMATLGLLPGSVLIIALGLMAWYTGSIVFQFKLRYPQVRSYPEAGLIIAGRTGRWVTEIISILNLVFIAAAHVLTFTVVLNVLTDHSSCTLVFGIVGAIICFLCTLPRTLRGQSVLSAISCTSIIAAVLIAMIAIGIAKPDMKTVYIVAPSTVVAGAGSVSGMVIAYTGHVAYPNIIDEMKHERDFPKALAFLALTTIAFYLSVAVVIYVFAGTSVPSPAFGAASPIIRKICYGVAIPTVIVAGVIAASICAKRANDLFWRFRKAPEVVFEKSARAWTSWVVILSVLWAISWLIASLVPVFHELLTLIGAAFATQFCFAFNSVMWLFMQWQGHSEHGITWYDNRCLTLRRAYLCNWKKTALTGINLMILAISIGVSVVGTYAAAVDISKNGDAGKPFSCANNAH